MCLCLGCGWGEYVLFIHEATAEALVGSMARPDEVIRMFPMLMSGVRVRCRCDDGGGARR
jgi:hypothetical protein